MFRAARITFFSSKKTNGQMRSGSLGPPSCRTPPVERKSKFSTLGKLFKPWKWKRKKKSEKFEQTSRSLERKISVRATREELIQRGVLILDPIIQETESVKELPEKSANGSVTTDHSISSESPAVVGLETNTFPSQDYDSLPKVTISSEAVIATEPTPITTIQVEPPENIVTDTQSGSPYISPAASGIVMSEEMLRHMEIENNNPFENEPPEMDEPDYDNPTEINCNEGSPEEMFCSVFFDIVQIGLPVPDYDDNDEPGIQIPIIRLPQPNPDIDTTKIEEIPAKDPDLRARPLKSALKKKGEPGTPTANYPPDIKTLRNDGSLSPSFLQFPMTNLVVNNSENKENRPRLPIPVRKIADVNAKDDAPVKFRDENDDEEKNRIAAKIARKNSLALKLSQRPDRQELIDRNIIPSQTETERQETIEAIGNKLSRRLSLRPTQQELEQRNILKQQTPAEEKKEKEEKKIMLLRKLSFRPTIEELKERKIIRFNDYVEVTRVEDYDRKADKPWTRLTPRDKAAIRKELNEFKSTEMEVHEDSRHFTRFHRP